MTAEEPIRLPAIRGSFQLTLADFTEANLPGASGARKSPWVWRGVAGWCFFFVVMLGLALFDSHEHPAPPALSRPPYGYPLILRFFVAMAPFFLLCVPFTYTLIRSVFRKPRPWESSAKRNWSRRGIVWVVALFAYMTYSTLTHPDPSSPGVSPDDNPIVPRLYELALPVMAWFTTQLSFNIYLAFDRVWGKQMRWKAQPFLHRPHRIEVTEKGLVLEEPESFHRFAWSHFPGFRETENLFLLYTSPFAFWMVPKRAFAESNELQTFRALILSGIKHGTFLPNQQSAFPVMPASTTSTAM